MGNEVYFELFLLFEEYLNRDMIFDDNDGSVVRSNWEGMKKELGIDYKGEIL